MRMGDPFQDVIQEPMQLFAEWLRSAEQSEPNDPNAAALATASSKGAPSVRMVLIKGSDERGLRFFTSRESQKGIELLANPVAALCFHWKSLRRQVRFEGGVSELERDEVEAYFHSRSRASQIAAAVSDQSRMLTSRQELEDRTRAFAEELGEKKVPLPDFWVGYVLVPRAIEFWLDGPDRLHDRLQFTKGGSGWRSRRLYP